MPTESLLVKFSSARAWRTTTANQLAVINNFKAVLLAADWDLTDSYSAVGIIDFPLSVPTVDGGTITPKRVVGCGTPLITLNGQGFQLYDPGREVPLAGSGCAFVTMGTTPAATLGYLTAAITAATSLGFTATWALTTLYQVTLTANVAGPLANYTPLAGDGRWVTVGIISGGGYELSATNTQSPFSVRLTSTPAFGFEQLLHFDFGINGGRVQYDLSTNTVASYTVIANPHSFYITDGTDDNTFLQQRSLFAFSPYLLGPLSYCVIVVGPANVPIRTFYYKTSSVAIDGPPITFGNSGGYPKMLAFRCAGTVGLLTPNGKPIATTAYVSAGKGPADIGAIVGILYDCVMHSDAITAPTGIIPAIMLNSVRFTMLGRQDGSGGTTRSSLLMAIPIAQLRVAKTGTLNLFGFGATQVSGDTFDATDVGRVITITKAGVSYSETIASVTDSTHLTLLVATGVLAGATFVIP